MARVKFGSIITSIQGSIGGSTFQANKYGYSVKRKHKVINKNTEYQARFKAAMRAAVSAWQSLTDTQRELFNTFATNYPAYSKNNSDSALSGYIYFLRYRQCFEFWNRYDENVFQYYPPIDEPASSSITMPSMTSALMKSDSATDPTTMTLRVYSDITEELTFCVGIYLSPILSATRTSDFSKCRYIQFTTEFNKEEYPATAYKAMFGYLPKIGDQVNLRVRVLSASTPQMSSFFEKTCTVEST